MSLSRYYQDKNPIFEVTMMNKLVFRATEVEIIYYERIHHRRGFSRDYCVFLLSFWSKLPQRALNHAPYQRDCEK